MTMRGQDSTRAEGDQQQQDGDQAAPDEDNLGEDEVQIQEAKADDEAVRIQEERSNVGWFQPGWLGMENSVVIKPESKKRPRALDPQTSEVMVIPSSESESVLATRRNRRSSREQTPCRHWERGRCRYSDCRFSHAKTGAGRRERSPCKHWERGRCKYTDCKFSHANAGGWANKVRSRSRRRHR
jgi:hypothetical protein